MSRLATMSPAALRAMFSPDADDDLIALLTISGDGMATQRIADGYTNRISETADEVVYGVTSRGNDYIFLPVEVAPPSDDPTSAPRFQISIHDVTQILIPVLRSIVGQPTVLLEYVLNSSPDTVEASFPDFLMGAITYNDNTISAELTLDSLSSEPFPAHTMTPSYLPGLF